MMIIIIIIIIMVSKKQENLLNSGLWVPVDYRVKLKENEKKNEYLNLARELKKLRYLKATMILIVIGALGTVTKRLVQEVEDLEIRG